MHSSIVHPFLQTKFSWATPISLCIKHDISTTKNTSLDSSHNQIKKERKEEIPKQINGSKLTCQQSWSIVSNLVIAKDPAANTIVALIARSISLSISSSLFPSPGSGPPTPEAADRNPAAPSNDNLSLPKPPTTWSNSAGSDSLSRKTTPSGWSIMSLLCTGMKLKSLATELTSCKDCLLGLSLVVAGRGLKREEGLVGLGLERERNDWGMVAAAAMVVGGLAPEMRKSDESVWSQLKPVEGRGEW